MYVQRIFKTTTLLLYVLFNYLITDFLHVIKQQSYMLYFYTKS